MKEEMCEAGANKKKVNKMRMANTQDTDSRKKLTAKGARNDVVRSLSRNSP